MIKIKSLENTPPSEIHKAFQAAFANYFVTLDPREEINLARWKSGGVDFSLSFGAFLGEKLVGFILHAPKGDTIFNLGTGVIPEGRGQKVIDQIYSHALANLKSKGFRTTELEVITINHPAIKVYQRTGFKVVRELKCYRGQISLAPQDAFSYSKGEVEFTDEMRDLITYPFSFEQSETALLRPPKSHELHLLKNQNELLAYAIFHPGIMGFAQVCAKEPFYENAANLLSRMNLQNQSFKMNNVDSRNLELNQFWTRLGLENHISQYEMKMDL